MATSRRQIIERRKARWENFREFISSINDSISKKLLLKEINKNIYYEDRRLEKLK